MLYLFLALFSGSPSYLTGQFSRSESLGSGKLCFTLSQYCRFGRKEQIEIPARMCGLDKIRDMNIYDSFGMAMMTPSDSGPGM